MNLVFHVDVFFASCVSPYFVYDEDLEINEKTKMKKPIEENNPLSGSIPQSLPFSTPTAPQTLVFYLSLSSN